MASARMTNEELHLVRSLAGTIGTGLFTTVPRTGASDGLLVSDDRNPNTTGATLVWQSGERIGRALIGLDFPSPFERDALLMTIPGHGEGYRLCEPVSADETARLAGR